MILELTEGCMFNDFTIDGNNFYNIDRKKLKQIALEVIDKLDCDINVLYREFEEMVYAIGEMSEQDKSCISTIKLKDKLIEFVYNNKLEQTYIDSKPIEDFRTDDIKDVWKEIISSYCSCEQIFDMLENLIRNVGKAKKLSYCATCGDTIYVYSIKI